MMRLFRPAEHLTPADQGKIDLNAALVTSIPAGPIAGKIMGALPPSIADSWANVAVEISGIETDAATLATGAILIVAGVLVVRAANNLISRHHAGSRYAPG